VLTVGNITDEMGIRVADGSDIFVSSSRAMGRVTVAGDLGMQDPEMTGDSDSDHLPWSE